MTYLVIYCILAVGGGSATPPAKHYEINRGIINGLEVQSKAIQRKARCRLQTTARVKRTGEGSRQTPTEGYKQTPY